jgi:hypothetical protein
MFKKIIRFREGGGMTMKINENVTLIIEGMNNTELIKMYNNKNKLLKDIMLNNSNINVKGLQDEIIAIELKMKEIAGNEGLNMCEYYQKYTFEKKPDTECKLPTSVHIIIDDLGEIENVFYSKEKG